MARSFSNAILASALLFGSIAPLAAQDAAAPPPAAATCGGLLCDMGLIKPQGVAAAVAPAAAPAAAAPVAAPSSDCGFFCRNFGIGRPAPAPAPVRTVETAPEPAAAPMKTHHRKMKRTRHKKAKTN